MRRLLLPLVVLVIMALAGTASAARPSRGDGGTVSPTEYTEPIWPSAE